MEGSGRSGGGAYGGTDGGETLGREVISMRQSKVAEPNSEAIARRAGYSNGAC